MSLRGSEATKQSLMGWSNKTKLHYIMTNKSNRVLYTGVTGNLAKRVYELKNKLRRGFTQKYNVNKLVYYEIFGEIEEALISEKQIKGGSRQKKIQLVESVNKDWKDLSDTLI